MAQEQVATTPAGERLRDWWDTKFDSQQFLFDWDEVARVVLNVVPAEDDEPISALVEALRAELSMFTASDDQWRKVATGITTRLEGLGMILVRSTPTEGGTE